MAKLSCLIILLVISLDVTHSWRFDRRKLTVSQCAIEYVGISYKISNSLLYLRPTFLRTDVEKSIFVEPGNREMLFSVVFLFSKIC